MPQVQKLQYENLRKHFSKCVKEIFGENYYNEGMDVYTCDEFSCRDIVNEIKSLRKRRWWLLFLK